MHFTADQAWYAAELAAADEGYAAASDGDPEHRRAGRRAAARRGRQGPDHRLATQPKEGAPMSEAKEIATTARQHLVDSLLALEKAEQEMIGLDTLDPQAVPLTVDIGKLRAKLEHIEGTLYAYNKYDDELAGYAP